MRPKTIDSDTYFSTNEAAEYLGVSRDWVRARLHSGMFDTFRHGRWTYITRESAQRVKDRM